MFDRLIATFNALGSAWIFLLMLLILADVVGRGAFSAPVRGVPEMVALSIVAIVFMQAAHTLKIGRMTRSDAVLDKLAGTRPRTRSALLAVNDVFGFAVMAILAWATGPRAFKSWEYQGLRRRGRLFHRADLADLPGRGRSARPCAPSNTCAASSATRERRSAMKRRKRM